MSADDASTHCPARDDAEGWRDEALAARAALYLIKVAAARPDLTRHDAWRREHAMVGENMVRGASCMCDHQWTSWDWRRDTLAIIAPPEPNESRTTTRFRARVMALLDDM